MTKKMILIKKILFFYMNPNCPKYILQTRHEHLVLELNILLEAHYGGTFLFSQVVVAINSVYYMS